MRGAHHLAAVLAWDDPDVDSEELDGAETELTSLLRKCEAVLQGSTLSASRTTLMTNRVAALRIAVELARREKSGSAAPTT